MIATDAEKAGRLTDTVTAQTIATIRRPLLSRAKIILVLIQYSAFYFKF
jgi:hypothetical protein